MDVALTGRERTLRSDRENRGFERSATILTNIWMEFYS